MTPQPGEGIAIRCDARGVVQSVVSDELGVSLRVPPGSSIVQIAAGADAEKARQFLLSLQNLHAAFNWEIAVPFQGGVAPLNFSGGAVENGFLIVAARSRNDAATVSEQLTEITNEQANAHRSTAKELARENDGGVYDELMRVNNDLANLQRELFRRNVELAAMNEQKNQFLGMAAHDLRSPLGAIMSYSEFLEEEAGPQLSQEHREFITTIKDSSHFMLGLINDLLDVTQFESGKLKMELRPTDLLDLVRRNVALNLVLASKKQIRVVLNSGSPLPPLPLDRGKIEQVLNNLLSNAIKFSHVNTEVSVILSREDRHVAITIADQGQGIPEEDLPKLFKPFSRTRVRSTGGEPSTGLGLSIVRRIVEGHGGTVDVESQVGTGASFRVRLPFDPSIAPTDLE
ncbi:MAG: HAMP domain-containing sensor histidine kinase [Bryobacteraceae bacterium]|jgi:two-component system, OmpR family, sensor kinase